MELFSHFLSFHVATQTASIIIKSINLPFDDRTNILCLAWSNAHIMMKMEAKNENAGQMIHFAVCHTLEAMLMVSESQFALICFEK